MARFRSLFRRRSRKLHPKYSTESSSSETRSHSDLHNPDDPIVNEFCNSFWGESGYDKLLKRVKTSDKLLEDLRYWFKERAALEADYSKRLAKLSRASVFGGREFGGGDGINDGLHRLQDVTARSAHAHGQLSKNFKQDLELKVSEFITRRDSARKTPQALVEKLHKKLQEFKTLQEKARKKFEVDAIAVNGYGAQLQLVQGREMDRVTVKLDKAKASIVLTEKNYRVLTSNLQAAVEEWILQWKMFCDLIQDLEEDRIDFIRSSLWDYSNGLSAVIVMEDEQCEMIRKTLERCDTRRDIRQFISQCSSGAELYRAPPFINYIDGEHEAPSHLARKRRVANFIRNSCRTIQPPPTRSSCGVQEFVDSFNEASNWQDHYPQQSIEDQASIPYMARKLGRYDGTIADVIASNAMIPNYSNSERGVKLLPPSTCQQNPQVLYDPHHHESFNGPGILVSR